MIPFPFFEPDRSPFSGGASPRVVNCLPVADGWGPLSQFVPISLPLPGEPKGAVIVRSSLGAYSIFAGTTDALYRLNTGDYSWDDVSGPSAPYAVPSGDNWQFKQFGSTLIATQLGSPVQAFDVGSGTDFDDLPGSPPHAKYVDAAGDFVILAHLAGNPMGLRTSALGDAGFWTTGLRLSQDQSMPDGEDIQGLLGSETGVFIFQRRKIRLLGLTTNVDYPFAINVVNADRGVIAPRSIAGIGPGMVGYLSSDGFCLGIEGRPIGGERVDRWFNNQIDQNALTDVIGAADPYNKIIWWQATTPENVRFMVGYNWQLDRWCYSDQNTTTLTDLVTPAISWDGIDQFFADWNEAQLPWDSRMLTGGLPVFGAFDDQYRLGFFTGSPMAARLRTARVQMTPGRRSFVRGARLIGDAENFTMRIAAMSRHSDEPSMGAAVAPAATGVCHFRSSGLLHQFEARMPAGEAWSIIAGLEPEAGAEGTR